MSQYYSELAAKVEKILAGTDQIKTTIASGELTIEVSKDKLIEVCTLLRDTPELGFDVLIDTCGIDYDSYEGRKDHPSRFASVYHLLSVKNNHRIRVRTFLDNEMPMVDSLVQVWSAANWFEREAFDLFGIIYVGHPDLRRILTDYGFIGHPLRKDFPLVGQVEMRYDSNKQRVIYEPVSLEERVVIPRVVREDNRYEKSGE